VSAGWTILGAPLDSSGAGRGEERAPDALRAAGVATALDARDAGDATALLRPATRDAATGVIAVDSLRAASAALAGAVAGVLRAGGRPLVLGGDCSLLPGALSGCRMAGLAPGLWMLDGHPDMLDGITSPTGEAADMDLAIALGRGPAGLVDLAGEPPLLVAERTVVLGLRPRGLDPDNDAELAALPAGVTWRDTREIAAQGAGEAGAEAARVLAEHDGHAWLHLDLDVLDAAAMPAVTYGQAQGLTWEALHELLGPLVRSRALVGMSVSDLVPDRDPDGRWARRTVELLAGLSVGPQ
jgi:arginase